MCNILPLVTLEEMALAMPHLFENHSRTTELDIMELAEVAADGLMLSGFGGYTYTYFGSLAPWEG